MKIGEVGKELGVQTRMLRYYEQQGLIQASRSTNGYREYSDEQIEHARHVRALIAAGLSTRMIKIVLNIETPATQGQSTVAIGLWRRSSLKNCASWKTESSAWRRAVMLSLTTFSGQITQIY